MNCRQKLFLDTTIQIDRFFETLDRKQKISEALAESECYTCTIVLREFKFRVIKACIALFHIIEEHNSESDVLTEIAREFNKGKLSMLLKIYAQVKRDAGMQDQFDKELALETIRLYITGHLLLKFKEILAEPESDITKCEVACCEVQESSGMFDLETHCERSRAKCNLQMIYQDNKEHLKRVKEIVENQSTQKLNRQEKAEFKKINEAYSDVLESEKENWNMVKGQHNCDKLADLTIMIESLDDSAVYTTDRIYECFYNRLCFPNKEAPITQKYPRSSKKGKRIDLKSH